MANGDSIPVETTIPVDTGADVFIEMLNANDVKYIFINAGTDTFPIQETIAKYRDQGKPTPEVVICPDEQTAISAAHGYFTVSRKPQVVLVHVDAGTMALGGGMHNAQRGRAGIVICAGRAPITFDGELEGGRNMSIHWTQEQIDQAAGLRNFTKWDYELRRSENAQHVIQRAFQIAAAEPPGPVYMTLPRETIMDRITEMNMPPVERYSAPITPGADPQAIEQAAQALVESQRPLVITGQSGRNQSTVAALVELAEAIGAPVVSDSTYVNFPSDHPMAGSGGAQSYLQDADVILMVDQDVPYIPNHGKPRPDARIIQIDIDPVKANIPMWVFPVDQLIHADSSKAVPALVNAINRSMTEADRARVAERYQTISDRHERLRDEAIELAKSHANRDVITPQWLSYCLGQVVDDDTLLMNECVTNAGVVARYVERNVPGTAFQSGGSSLGWALGGSLGAKLAEPDKNVVATVGDGSFIYGCPTSSLWAADVFNAPFLAVIYNNQIHNAVKGALKGGYPDGYSFRNQNFVGMELGPSVEFSMVAQACRAYGEKVEDPAEVLPALRRAMEQIKSGKAAVLDVRIEKP